VASPPGNGAGDLPGRLALGLACAAPLLVLIAAWWRPTVKWGAWVAVVMVPYVTLAVTAALLATTGRWAAILFAGLTVLVFFTGLDAGRRLGAFRRDVAT
jgi:hypothetical protein